MQTQLLRQHATAFANAEMYEYLLVVNPGAEANAQLAEETRHFYSLYRQGAAIAAKPRITAASFYAKEAMEETIIRYMHRIISARTSFSVMLNNYSGQPPGEVFIRIQQPEPFKQLAESMRVVDHYVRGNGYPAARLVGKPHVTISGGLPESIYNKAMLDYSKRIFNASFMVTELVLLKRKSEFEACKQVNVFRLKPEA